MGSVLLEIIRTKNTNCVPGRQGYVVVAEDCLMKVTAVGSVLEDERERYIDR